MGGKFEGKGHMEWFAAGVRTAYEGQYLNGLEDGQGRLIYPDGTVHAGVWSRGEHVMNMQTPDSPFPSTSDLEARSRSAFGGCNSPKLLRFANPEWPQLENSRAKSVHSNVTTNGNLNGRTTVATPKGKN